MDDVKLFIYFLVQKIHFNIELLIVFMLIYHILFEFDKTIQGCFRNYNFNFPILISVNVVISLIQHVTLLNYFQLTFRLSHLNIKINRQLFYNK